MSVKLKRILAVAIFLVYALPSAAWVCPDLENGEFPDYPWQIYDGYPTGHDQFKRIVITGYAVLCSYQIDSPWRGLKLVQWGYFEPLDRDAEHWHKVGGGTSAKYCIDGREICKFH